MNQNAYTKLRLLRRQNRIDPNRRDVAFVARHDHAADRARLEAGRGKRDQIRALAFAGTDIIRAVNEVGRFHIAAGRNRNVDAGNRRAAGAGDGAENTVGIFERANAGADDTARERAGDHREEGTLEDLDCRISSKHVANSPTGVTVRWRNAPAGIDCMQLTGSDSTVARRATDVENRDIGPFQGLFTVGPGFDQIIQRDGQALAQRKRAEQHGKGTADHHDRRPNDIRRRGSPEKKYEKTNTNDGPAGEVHEKPGAAVGLVEVVFAIRTGGV